MRFTIALIVLLGFLTSCTNRVAEYRSDAETFCKLHSMELWESRKGYTALENLDHLTQQIRTSIKTKEFREIFDRLSKSGYNDLYAALQPDVSKLIGEDWNCEDARKFYSVEWKRTDDDSGSYVVSVVALNETTLEIGKKEYKITDHQGISDAISEASQGKDYKIYLTVPTGITSEQLNGYLEPFRHIGVKSLSVKYR